MASLIVVKSHHYVHTSRMSVETSSY